MMNELTEYIPANLKRLGDNHAPRVPLIIISDSSGSMNGEPINELNKGYQALEKDLKDDPTAKYSVGILCIQCSDHKPSIITNWTDAVDFNSPFCYASGGTPLGASLNLALDLLQQEKDNLDHNCIVRNRALMCVISDGAPTDPEVWAMAADRCKREMERDGVVVFPFGAGPYADITTLSQCSTIPAVDLKGYKFKKLFLHISKISKLVSQSKLGERVQIPACTI